MALGQVEMDCDLKDLTTKASIAFSVGLGTCSGEQVRASYVEWRGPAFRWVSGGAQGQADTSGGHMSPYVHHTWVFV